jgi:hypothetical protein
MNSKLVWLDKFKEKNIIDLVKLLLFFFIVFTFSINLFYKISLDGAYVHGLLIDYLIPKIYLAEFFLIPFLIIEVKQLKKVSLNNFFCFFVLILLLRQLSSQNALAAFTHLIHFVEILLFFSVVKHDPLFKTKMAEKFILGAIFSVVLFQSLLANYQFIFQKSLLTYQFLGETNLNDFANISRAQFFFGEKILPYGTTAHPNILAGMIVIFSILIINKIRGCRKTQLVVVLNALLIIFLTQSLTALFTLGLYFIYRLVEETKARKLFVAIIYYFFIILLPYSLSVIANTNPSFDSINRRAALNETALKMFGNNPIFGVGINNFTLELENYPTNSYNKEIVRFVQPVHNLLFLILSEGGLLLIVVLLFLISQAKIDRFYQKSIILLAIASLDHYLLTQFSGLSLLALFYLFI